MWCGVKYHVHDFEPPYIYIYREDGDRRITKSKYLTIITDPTFEIMNHKRKKLLPEEEQLDSKKRALIDTLPTERRNLALEKMNIIAPILLYEELVSGDMYAAYSFVEKYQEYLRPKEQLENLKKNQLIERVAKKNNYSTRQVFRFLSKYKKSEIERTNHGIEGLVSKAHLNAHNRTDEVSITLNHPKKIEIILDTIYVRLPIEYVPLIKEELEKFIVKKKRKVSLLTENINILCTSRNLKPLSYDTVYKIVDRIDKYVFERISKGDIVEPQFLKEKASNQFAFAPLHVIEIDHVRLPITLIDPNTGVELGEPTLTLGLCVFTRMVWGLDLSFEDPSGNKVMRTLLNGICFKRAKEQYGTINDWEMHGVPSVIYMDNGSDFKSNYVKSMIEDVLRTELRYRPIATPRYGGIIERNFGTINTKFLENLLGYREKFSSGREVKKEARLEAILTLDDLRELLVHYITDVYHHSEHAGLPLECNTPVARLYTAMDVMGSLPFIPEEDEIYYKIQMLPSEMRTYRKDGIRVENVKYASQETSRFISKSQKKNCKIKFNVEDISKIYLLDPDSKEYIEVPSISPPADEIEGLSRKMYSSIRKNLIEQGQITKQQIPGSSLINKSKLLIREKYNHMVTTNTPARRRALSRGFELSVKEPEKKVKAEKVISTVEQLVAKLNAEKKNELL